MGYVCYFLLDKSFSKLVIVILETVGGSVDVAAISKGEGFIWVARKNYFDHEKNKHYWNNYYRGDEDENEEKTNQKTKK